MERRQPKGVKPKFEGVNWEVVYIGKDGVKAKRRDTSTA